MEATNARKRLEELLDSVVYIAADSAIDEIKAWYKAKTGQQLTDEEAFKILNARKAKKQEGEKGKGKKPAKKAPAKKPSWQAQWAQHAAGQEHLKGAPKKAPYTPKTTRPQTLNTRRGQ